jgi:hypothetical protein
MLKNDETKVGLGLRLRDLLQLLLSSLKRIKKQNKGKTLSLLFCHFLHRFSGLSRLPGFH